jgi:hypothetical protein
MYYTENKTLLESSNRNFLDQFQVIIYLLWLIISWNHNAHYKIAVTTQVCKNLYIIFLLSENIVLRHQFKNTNNANIDKANQRINWLTVGALQVHHIAGKSKVKYYRFLY